MQRIICLWSGYENVIEASSIEKVSENMFEMDDATYFHSSKHYIFQSSIC